MRRQPRRLGGALVLLATLLTMAHGATAHAYLESATPAPGASVRSGSSVVAVRFTESVDSAFTTLALSTRDGAPVPAETLVVPSLPREVRLVAEPLGPGAYTVRWRALSVDGDLADGSFSFAVGDEAAAPADAAVAPVAAGPTLAVGLLRGLGAVGLLAVPGVAFFVLEVDRPARIARRVPLALGALALAGALATAASVPALAVQLGTDVGGALATTNARLSLATAVLLIVAGAASLAALARPAEHRRARLVVATVAGLAAVVADALAGHAVAGQGGAGAGGELAFYVGLAHAAFAALWVGGVAGLLLQSPGCSPREVGALVHRFSPWAATGALGAAATGALYAWTNDVRPAQLAGEPYAWLLVVKSLLLAVALWLGWRHRSRWGPALIAGVASVRRFGTSVRREVGVLAALLIVAGVLAAAPTPAPSAQVDDAPEAGRIVETATGDHRVVMLLLPDPLVAGEESEVVVQVRSLSFRPVDDTLVRVRAPDGSERLGVRVGDGTWSAGGVLFTSPGIHTLTVLLDGPRGPGRVTVTAPVLDGGEAP